MFRSLEHELLMYAVYFAPRGMSRILSLGQRLAQRHLSPLDKLIGFIGDAGAGKSMFIKGMFPGLELTNDDEGVNTRPLPLLERHDSGFFKSHTYHVDIRFESAFTQMYELADAVKSAIDDGKRVVIEHFELLYPYLGVNAEILIGIGEEVIVTRPSIFGPLPRDIANIVFRSIKYRKMAHSAEDIASKILEEEYGCPHSLSHSDVKHGFVIEFAHQPTIDIDELEKKIKNVIDAKLDICYVDDTHITMGKNVVYHCTGPRIHMRNTGEIENFQLIKNFRYDPLTKLYALVGLVGTEKAIDINDLNEISILS